MFTALVRAPAPRLVWVSMCCMHRGAWRRIGFLAVALSLLPAYSQRRTSAHAVLYQSADGSFQFSHPDEFHVCTAGKMEPCRTAAYIPPCEEDALVCAVYPGERLKSNNFEAAAFQVREIHSKREAMTPDGCVTPSSDGGSAWPELQISAEHPAETIGGVLFVHGIRGEAAASHAGSVDLYRAYHNKRCFEISVTGSETNPNVADPPMKRLTAAQRKDVDESLARVLYSFRFR